MKANEMVFLIKQICTMTLRDDLKSFNAHITIILYISTYKKSQITILYLGLFEPIFIHRFLMIKPSSPSF